MSISSPQPGGNRRPSVIAKPAAGAKPRGDKPTGAKPSAGKPGGSRPPIKPVKAAGNRDWFPLALWALVGVIALGIVGYGGWQVYQNGLSWQDRAAKINGLVDFRKTEPDVTKPAQHAWGPLTYKQSPPVAGTHNYNWQNCMGDVYDAQIANEHAVHSMEHGAVWITYRPDLPKDQVAALAKKVRGNPYMLMSPYPGLDKPISLQAWGYQLKVDNASDKRIDEFIKALRQNASVEPGASCSQGITATGTTPHDLGKDQPGGTGQMGG